MKNRRTQLQEQQRTEEYGYLKKPNSPYIVSPVRDMIVRPFNIPEPLIPRPNRGYFTDNS